MPSFGDLFVGLDVNLARDLVKRGASYLRDNEARDLQRAQEDAFRVMLDGVADDLEQDDAYLLGSVWREFVRADGVDRALLGLTLTDRVPDLVLLRERFNPLWYDAASLPVDLYTALTALILGLTDASVEAAMEPESSLHSRVSLVRTAAVHSLLREQSSTQKVIAETLDRLEGRGGEVQVGLPGPTKVFTIADGATLNQAADLRPLLDQIIDLLNELAAEQTPLLGQTRPATHIPL